nr:hypothetical protein DGKKSRWO_DGKKSRWO_CDS_0028 [uncultured phage]CAI9752154.1 hypothetical protein CVNMHQAP_CVNMHQAP_CDS_0028 [uncultured phage]
MDAYRWRKDVFDEEAYADDMIKNIVSMSYSLSGMIQKHPEEKEFINALVDQLIETLAAVKNTEVEEVEVVDEAFEKDGGPFWYFTTHGVMPGSVPKDIDILDVVDTPNGSYFLTDKVLTTKELQDYEIKEKKPENV